MSDDPGGQLERLQQAIVDLEKACKRALGFTGTIEYMGISFNVSPRLVTANLSPIAYLQLVEHIDQPGDEAQPDGPQEAVVRLYNRLAPLLSCVHQWTPLSRAEDAALRGATTKTTGRPYICKLCTAYAFERSLPAVGRSSAAPTP